MGDNTTTSTAMKIFTVLLLIALARAAPTADDTVPEFMQSKAKTGECVHADSCDAVNLNNGCCTEATTMCEDAMYEEASAKECELNVPTTKCELGHLAEAPENCVLCTKSTRSHPNPVLCEQGSGGSCRCKTQDCEAVCKFELNAVIAKNCCRRANSDACKDQ